MRALVAHFAPNCPVASPHTWLRGIGRAYRRFTREGEKLLVIVDQGGDLRCTHVLLLSRRDFMAGVRPLMSLYATLCREGAWCKSKLCQEYRVEA